jgi:hypothetical protein
LARRTGSSITENGWKSRKITKTPIVPWRCLRSIQMRSRITSTDSRDEVRAQTWGLTMSGSRDMVQTRQQQQQFPFSFCCCCESRKHRLFHDAVFVRYKWGHE